MLNVKKDLLPIADFVVDVDSTNEWGFAGHVGKRYIFKSGLEILVAKRYYRHLKSQSFVQMGLRVDGGALYDLQFMPESISDLITWGWYNPYGEGDYKMFFGGFHSKDIDVRKNLKHKPDFEYSFIQTIKPW